jgi:predicted nucleotidyltransferase
VSSDALVTALRRRLESEPAVIAAWLFGSEARGTATAASDVDVAILTGAPPPRTLEELPLDLEADLETATGRRVQVVVIDRAAADLVHRVLRDGVLLVDRDRPRRVRFEVAARNLYFDMAPIWRACRRRGAAA